MDSYDLRVDPNLRKNSNKMDNSKKLSDSEVFLYFLNNNNSKTQFLLTAFSYKKKMKEWN